MLPAGRSKTLNCCYRQGAEQVLRLLHKVSGGSAAAAQSIICRKPVQGGVAITSRNWMRVMMMICTCSLLRCALLLDKQCSARPCLHVPVSQMHPTLKGCCQLWMHTALALVMGLIKQISLAQLTTKLIKNHMLVMLSQAQADCLAPFLYQRSLKLVLWLPSTIGPGNRMALLLSCICSINTAGTLISLPVAPPPLNKHPAKTDCCSPSPSAILDSIIQRLTGMLQASIRHGGSAMMTQKYSRLLADHTHHELLPVLWVLSCMGAHLMKTKGKLWKRGTCSSSATRATAMSAKAKR